MVDVSALGVISTSVNTLINMAKASMDVRDATMVDGEVFKLQRAIIDTQQSVFSANEERATLIEKVSDLEKEVSRLTEWNIEKDKYELVKVDHIGVYAYSRKSTGDDTEPHHFICTNCYQKGQKSILQATARTAMARRIHICPICKTEIAFSSVTHSGDTIPPHHNPFSRG
jgi:hypothetical protein